MLNIAVQSLLIFCKFISFDFQRFSCVFNRLPSSPSCAVFIFEIKNEMDYHQYIPIINQSQLFFKNTFVFVYGKMIRDRDWENFVFSIEPGIARLVRANNLQDVAKGIISCNEKMSDKTKLTKQSIFIKYEEENCLSSESLKSMIISYFYYNLRIYPSDTELLIQGFPTLSTLFSANRELLECNSPVDIGIIDDILEFLNDM